MRFYLIEMERWPNFFIVGAGKAGTTSLHRYLKINPDIFMSVPKEPNYFNSATIITKNPKSLGFIRDKNEYLSLFEKGKDKKILGESTATYLFDPQAPKLIHEIVPNAKILITLRDPVERLFSEYLMKKNKNMIKNSFHDELDITMNKHKRSRLGLKHGLYFHNVKRYLEVFGKKQVKIIIFEEFVKTPKETVEEIFKFLEVDYDTKNFIALVYRKFYPLVHGNFIALFRRKFYSLVHNKYDEKKFGEKPKISNAERQILNEYYYEDVKKLEELLGQKLPWDNFSN